MTDQHNDAAKGKSGHGNLTLYIIIAIVVAVVLALVWPSLAVKLEMGGEIFLRLLQMVVVPLVMASVMSGILGLGDVRRLGRPGLYAVLYYLSTTVLAVGTGLLVVNVINPGVGMQPELVEDARQEGADAVADAKEALKDKPKDIVWGPNRVAKQQQSGSSKPLTISPLYTTELRVTLQQQNRAERRATLRVMVSRGELKQEGAAAEAEAEDVFEVHEIKQEFQFDPGLEPAVYHWSTLLPAGIKKIRLEYEAPEGTAATLSAEAGRGPPTIGDIFKNLVLMLFTDNLLESMVKINLLPLIVFSIVFAGMLTTMGARSEAIANLVMSINDALMNFILLLMKLAPIGIFCLVAARFGKAQLEGQFLELIAVQAKYMITVLAGLAIHALITLPLILWLTTRRNPYRFMLQMSQAILTAFSTASSTATLPVTMETAEVKAGVSRRSAEFVLPLGATINMDGTALYEAAAAIFIAQAYQVVNPEFELTLMKQATIAITATLAAIGAAGIPEAGLVTMLIVLNAVGLPPEMIGLILPVDWLLDRFRTAVNAFGDSVGAAVVDKTFTDP